ncbi:mechanosensitive ion channel domain-containing protein [Azohydromonas sp.]|uniref:mechanosensitive ion channel family protein n=1 Tax=Azohydromonas sp. TaxID=1872666 RepID=UPI002BBC3101|nr:mechanosensitive ion channel domain-containing protein [Azohydromonas sp.]HMM84070.1 mechanosensitive ion channel [Azohydromonas sp.]
MQLKLGAELDALLAEWSGSSVAGELALLALCLGAAAAAVRLLRGAEPRPGSVWFGERIVDGVLFPVLALGAALLVRWLVRDTLPATVLHLAVPVLGSLVIIRVGVRVLRAAFPVSALVRALERTLSWLVWIGLVLWLTGLLPTLRDELEAMRWRLGGTEVTVLALIEGALTAVVVLVLMLWLSSAVESRLLAGLGSTALRDQSLRKIAANVTRALLLTIGLLIALSAAGIPLGALGVLGGAIGVGIGLGLQKLAANYVSGFVILAERSLRIGDTVRVDGFEGRITDIKTRYTLIRSLGGRESIVPNEMLMTSRIENLSLADPQLLLSTVVQVAYGSDVEAVMARLARAVTAVPRVLADPAPSVRLTAFAADGLELTVFFWIADPDNGQANVRSAVNLEILRTLDAMGVPIPYPQRVVHMPAPAPAAGDAPPRDEPR